MFIRPLSLSLCGVVRGRLRPRSVVVTAKSMGCIVYTDYVYPAFVTLLADISCLLFLFRKCLFVVVLFSLSSLLFHHTSSLKKNLWLIVISLAHSAVTYWSCFAIHKHLRHLKNMKWLLRHGIYNCIYCVKIFSRWNIPKTRSEAKLCQNRCSGAHNTIGGDYVQGPFNVTL